VQTSKSGRGERIIRITAQGRQQPRIEQVTKIMVEPAKERRGAKDMKIAASRGQKDMKIVAQERASRVATAKGQPRVADAPGRGQARAEKVARVTEPRRSSPDPKAGKASRAVQVAEKPAKGKTAAGSAGKMAAVSAQKKTAAPVRVAANTHTSCSAKGAARKSCRAA
jgi:hypothetical protein